MQTKEGEYTKPMREQQKSFNAASFTYFLIVVLFVTMRLLSSFGLLKFMGEGGDYFFTILIQVVLLFCGSMFLYPALKKQKTKFTCQEFAIKKISGKAVGFSILLGAVVFFLNMYVSSAFNGFISLLGYEHSSQAVSSYSFGNLVLNLIFTAFLPAVCEEVAHRGMLLRAYQPLGTWKAILISSLMFGLLHINIEQFFYATIIGLFLGLLTMMCNSIIPAMIIHFMNNALSTYLLFSEVNGLPLGKFILTIESVLTSNVFVGMLLSIFIIIALVWLGKYLLDLLVKNRIGEDFGKLQQQFLKEVTRQKYLLSVENSRKEFLGEEPIHDPIEQAELMQIKDFAAYFEDKQEPFVPSKYAKLLTCATLVLGAVLTIFTFVWGVL